MPLQKPKTRMISIRLSDEEYTGLKQVCISNGWASVSEIARAAMQNVLRDGALGSMPVEQCVQQLTGQMDLLNQKVERLAEHVEAVAKGTR